ncbi:MAG: hypothetical protein ACJAV6_000259 [Candidatus Paceibacteria bacterium]|jgi:hypothetical protein
MTASTNPIPDYSSDLFDPLCLYDQYKPETFEKFYKETLPENELKIEFDIEQLICCAAFEFDEGKIEQMSLDFNEVFDENSSKLKIEIFIVSSEALPPEFDAITQGALFINQNS